MCNTAIYSSNTPHIMYRVHMMMACWKLANKMNGLCVKMFKFPSPLSKQKSFVQLLAVISWLIFRYVGSDREICQSWDIEPFFIDTAVASSVSCDLRSKWSSSGPSLYINIVHVTRVAVCVRKCFNSLLQMPYGHKSEICCVGDLLSKLFPRMNW